MPLSVALMFRIPSWVIYKPYVQLRDVLECVFMYPGSALQMWVHGQVDYQINSPLESPRKDPVRKPQDLPLDLIVEECLEW